MKKLTVALAIVLGINMISSIVELGTPISYAQEEPAPAPKPEKPDSD